MATASDSDHAHPVRKVTELLSNYFFKSEFFLKNASFLFLCYAQIHKTFAKQIDFRVLGNIMKLKSISISSSIYKTMLFEGKQGFNKSKLRLQNFTCSPFLNSLPNFGISVEILFIQKIKTIIIKIDCLGKVYRGNQGRIPESLITLFTGN